MYVGLVNKRKEVIKHGGGRGRAGGGGGGVGSGREREREMEREREQKLGSWIFWESKHRTWIV